MMRNCGAQAQGIQLADPTALALSSDSATAWRQERQRQSPKRPISAGRGVGSRYDSAPHQQPPTRSREQSNSTPQRSQVMRLAIKSQLMRKS